MSDILIANLPEHGIVQDDDLLIIEGQTTDKITVNKLIAKATGDLANVENTGAATKAYAVGEFLITGGKFCKVTAPIRIGNALVVGGNIEETDVGSEISSLNAELANYKVIGTGTGTYAEALATLFPLFQSLSVTEKFKSIILKGNTIFRCIDIASGYYSYAIASPNSNLEIITLILQTKKAWSGNRAETSNISSVQTGGLALIVLP